MEEEYYWDFAESYWFFSGSYKTFQVGPNPEQIDGTWKQCSKHVLEYSKIHVPKKVGVLRAKPKDLVLN